jgi:phenylalanyl-tRNA synthetase beta chain
VVDVANYVLMELGHPLHTFDLKLLQGNKIVVRLANDGEKIVTLDNEERTMNKNHLLICDGEKPVALAGIMGCANSEVTESTTDILIESAFFDPITIRRGSKSLDLATEASKRFERGTDFDGLITALDRTAELLSELAGGDIDRGILDAYPNKILNDKITLQADKASELIGCEIDEKFIEKTFAALEISCKKTKTDLQLYRQLSDLI